MPNYDYECGRCGRVFEAYQTVENRKKSRCACGGKGKIVISPCHNIVYETYFDEGLGEVVTGPGHRRAIMHAKGLEECGDMAFEDRVQFLNKQRAEKKSEERPTQEFLDRYPNIMEELRAQNRH